MSNVEQLENQLAGSKELIERADAALRLHKNRDFQKLILEAFCRDECARYAQQSAEFSLTAEQRADALAMAQAAGHLMRFLSVTCQKADAVRGDLPELEDAISEARAEEGAE